MSHGAVANTKRANCFQEGLRPLAALACSRNVWILSDNHVLLSCNSQEFTGSAVKHYDWTLVREGLLRCKWCKWSHIKSDSSCNNTDWRPISRSHLHSHFVPVLAATNCAATETVPECLQSITAVLHFTSSMCWNQAWLAEIAEALGTYYFKKTLSTITRMRKMWQGVRKSLGHVWKWYTFLPHIYIFKKKARCDLWFEPLGMCGASTPSVYSALQAGLFHTCLGKLKMGKPKTKRNGLRVCSQSALVHSAQKPWQQAHLIAYQDYCGLLLGLISGECGCQAQDGAARSKRCSTTRVRSTTLFLVDFCVRRHRDHELVVQSAQHEGGFGSKGKVLESNTSRLDGIAFGQMLRSAIRARVNNYSLQGSERGGGSVPAVVFRKQLGLMHWRDLWIEQSSLVLVLKSIKCFQLQPHQLQVKTIGRAADLFSAAQHGLCFTNLTLPNEPTTKLASPAGTMHRLDSVAFCSLFSPEGLAADHDMVCVKATTSEQSNLTAKQLFQSLGAAQDDILCTLGSFGPA